MPTWKLKTESETLFFHLCHTCNDRSAEELIKTGWHKIRDEEPVSCNECTLKCALTAKGLWGEDDTTRYSACAECSEYDSCPLKGRHYC